MSQGPMTAPGIDPAMAQEEGEQLLPGIDLGAARGGRGRVPSTGYRSPSAYRWR